MRKLLSALAAFGLLALPTAQIGRAVPPGKLTSAELNAFTNEISDVDDGYQQLLKSTKPQVKLACPLIKRLPARLQTSYKELLSGDVSIAENHAADYRRLATKVNEFLKRAGAYPTAADRDTLEQGVSAISFGLRMQADAVETYGAGLQKGVNLDCAGFLAAASRADKLYTQGKRKVAQGQFQILSLVE